MDFPPRLYIAQYFIPRVCMIEWGRKVVYIFGMEMISIDMKVLLGALYGEQVVW